MIKKLVRWFIFPALVLASPLILPVGARADTIQTSDGRLWNGLIVAENSQQVWIDLGFDIAALDRGKIVRIRRSDPSTSRLIAVSLKMSRQKRDHLLMQRAQKPTEVPFTTFQDHVIVEVLLDDRVPAKLLLDTGSTFTFLSPRVAKQLGIPKKNGVLAADVLTSDGRKKRMVVASVSKISVGKAEARDVQVAILPQMQEDTPFADGLLGVSFLSRFNFKIDYQKHLLILEPNGSKGLSTK